MSSKKKYFTIGIDENMVKRLDELAERDKRGRSFYMEAALVKYFASLQVGEKQESHADKTTALHD